LPSPSLWRESRNGPYGKSLWQGGGVLSKVSLASEWAMTGGLTEPATWAIRISRKWTAPPLRTILTTLEPLKLKRLLS
jgi:hypothetical protein